jgi:leucyl-tRNA synthetase
LGWYGEGAVMVVPAHDERDYEFAQKFNLPIKVVITENQKSKIKNQKLQLKIKNEQINKAFTNYGVLVNSGEFTGLTSKEAIKKITEKLEALNLGKKAVVYHLRDWSISRQRYWGTPIPVVYCKNCFQNKIKKENLKNENFKEGIDWVKISKESYAIVLVPEENLPVELPYEVDFTPKGKPPLASNEKWLKTKCPVCGKEAMRDAQTMDTFFDSSWYFFRYVSPDFNQGPFDKELVAKLTPVDIYFGGAEHTLGHTLYARFFTKFFHDLGLVNYEEFALKRVQHGIVLGPDGNKMSKSKGNVINPDEQVKEYGADTVRMYLCFMMPYEGTGPWSHTAIAGVYRFLKRVWETYQKFKIKNQKLKIDEDKELVVKLNKTIKKVTEDIERIKLNTAVAAMMEFINAFEKSVESNKSLSADNAKKFLQILAPFAPFLTEEIWREIFGEKTSIHLSSWPKAEEIKDEEIIIPVQVNGKLRATIKVKRETCNVKREIEKIALENEKVKKYLAGKKYKMIYVEGKIVNFIII